MCIQSLFGQQQSLDQICIFGHVSSIFMMLHAKTRLFSLKQHADLEAIILLIKGTHTVYFSSSLYIINQKPMILKTGFRCITTWAACSSE